MSLSTQAAKRLRTLAEKEAPDDGAATNHANWGRNNMEQLRGLGWLPDIPSHLDYTENHPAVAALLQRTRLAPKIAAVAKGERAVAPAALPPNVDLRASFSPIE